MIITLIFIAFLIVGIIINDELPRIPLIAIGFFGTIFCILGICLVQIPKEVDYQNKVYEKEMLEYRIDNIEDNITGNEMIYNDIVEFNNDLRHEKKWINNPFTNWFYNEDIATIDYIELEDFKR